MKNLRVLCIAAFFSFSAGMFSQAKPAATFSGAIDAEIANQEK